MARRESSRAKLIEKEGPKEKQRRESLIQVSARGPVKSSKVFVWHKDDDTGFRVRTRIFQSEAYNTWSDCRSKHRRYDAVYNEWDLCSKFATEDQDALSEDNISDDDDFFDGEPTVPYLVSGLVPTLSPKMNLPLAAPNLSPTVPDPPPTVPNPPQVVSDVNPVLEADINDIYTFDSQFTVPSINFENALELHYGFLDNVPSSADWSEFGVQPLSNKDWLLLCKDYVQFCSDGRYPPQFWSMINYFTHIMLTFDPSLPSAPSHHVWDLRTSHHRSLRAKMSASPFQIEHMDIGGKSMYKLKLKHPQPHLEVEWRLVLEDVVTALHCICANFGYGLKDVALGLASIGASFRILHFVVSPQPPPSKIPDVPTLGHRPQGYRPTVGDYARYADMRNASLQQESHFRAAIARGRILWHLAIESLHPSLVLDEDPENDPLQHTQYFPSPDGHYREDILSDADETIICGLYHVYTGKGEQMAHKSWWPKPGVWAMKGLNVGYWSTGCEHWYQERLRMIREGTAQLRSVSEWMTALTFQKTTRKLVGRHDMAAKVFLSGEWTL